MCEIRRSFINNLTENVSRLAQKVGNLSKAVEKQEQNSRRNCLLLLRIPAKKQEHTDEQYIKTINELLDLA